MPGPISLANRSAIVARDKRHVWHPYTAMRRYLDDVEPLVIARAEGARLWDVDGRSYLDANSSWWVAVLGHGHPRLVRTLADQAARLCHVSLAGVTHEPAAALAEELCQIAPPGLDRALFSDDGSTAVEAALKIALQYWQYRDEPRRTRFVALDGAFHGETLGCTAVSGVEVFRRPFAGVVLECVHVPAPCSTGRPGESGGEAQAYARAFSALAEIVRDGAQSIAAVVVEPLLQGAAGMRVYPPAFLRELASLCREHDVLWIADEVFTGYGRTGTMWACDQAGVSPDLMCLAKGFTGGMLPMAATLAKKRVFDVFAEPDRMLFHGHSFCGNPLGAAIAREVLTIYREEQVLERARPKMKRIADAFAAFGRIAGVARTRSLGMMGALDLAADGGYLGRAGWRVYDQALARGAYLRPLGDTVYIAPPLTIDDAELEELLGIVDASVRAIHGSSGPSSSG
jgi:adenosylmethionine-8-amino-7-oxononanoate aminotransferase